MDGDYIVTRDGEQVTAPFSTDYEAWAYLHRAQSQSVPWAVRYSGWDIIYPDGTCLSGKQKG
jgi:hypothetical protein